MDLIIEKEWKYIPRFRGNETEKEQVTCILQQLTPIQRERCIETEYGSDGRGHTTTNLAMVVRFGVKEIKHLSVNGSAVKTGDDLCNAIGAEELYAELASQILSKAAVKGDEVKNS
uniref:Uncharacterized protein n=1 Tax=viral metagenome TaxID=1070528 RepID=A0A6M3L2E0_9ZZZZ